MLCVSYPFDTKFIIIYYMGESASTAANACRRSYICAHVPGYRTDEQTKAQSTGDRSCEGQTKGSRKGFIDRWSRHPLWGAHDLPTVLLWNTLSYLWRQPRQTRCFKTAGCSEVQRDPNGNPSAQLWAHVDIDRPNITNYDDVM